MLTIKCPITNEIILTISDRVGKRKRSNYTEIFLTLRDGSKIKIPVSNTAIINKENIDKLFNTIVDNFKEKVNNKEVAREVKKRHLKRLKKMSYANVSNKQKIIFKNGNN